MIASVGRQCGMTLIELLVVLVIVTLMSSWIMISSDFSARFFNREAGQAQRLGDELSRVFSYVDTRAQLNGDVYAWSATAPHWWQWRYSTDDGQVAWREWAGSPMSPTIPVELVLESSSAQTMIMFIPGQGIEPFEIIVRARESGLALTRIWADAASRVQWETL